MEITQTLALPLKHLVFSFEVPNLQVLLIAHSLVPLQLLCDDPCFLLFLFVLPLVLLLLALLLVVQFQIDTVLLFPGAIHRCLPNVS